MKLNIFLTFLFNLFIKIIFLYIVFFFKNSDLSKKKKISAFLLIKLEHFSLSIFKALQYKINILYDNKKYIARYEVGKNIFLYSPNTNKFKKNLGNNKYTNHAEVIYNLIANKTPTIVDIGSFIGEISIFFAKNKSQSKVFSFEASKKNFNIQKQNIKFNNIKNIKLNNLIVDKENNSYKYISENLKSENYILEKTTKFASKIKTISLNEITKEYNISYIDYLKIDIENSIYRLTEDLIDLIEHKKIGIMNLAFEKTEYNNLKKLIEFICKKTKIYKVNYSKGIIKKISNQKFKKTLSKKLPFNAGEYIFKINL